MKGFLKFIKANQSRLFLVLGVGSAVLIVGGVGWSYQHRAANSLSQISATSTETALEEEQVREMEGQDQTNQGREQGGEVDSIVYEVKRGDSLWKIAQRELGSGYGWKKIYDDNKEVIGNNPGWLKIGQRVIVNRQNIQVETVDTTYTVKPSDNLWNIAQKFCGDGFIYAEIAKVNHISTPALIRPGQKLAVRCTRMISVATVGKNVRGK